MSGVTFRVFRSGDWTGEHDEQLIFHSLYDLVRLLEKVKCPVILNRDPSGVLTLEIYEP